MPPAEKIEHVNLECRNRLLQYRQRVDSVCLLPVARRPALRQRLVVFLVPVEAVEAGLLAA